MSLKIIMPEIAEIIKPLLSLLKKNKLNNLGIIVFAILSMIRSIGRINL